MERSVRFKETTSAANRARPIRGLNFGLNLLAPAGIRINGPDPWDVQIHHPDTVHRIVSEGQLGVGEAYMDGWWDCESLDECVNRLLRTGFLERIGYKRAIAATLYRQVVNLQRRTKAFEIGERHYDLGNDIFEAMLDPSLTYSCGYWEDAATLQEAQENKLELVCRKLRLEPGMRVLDIGCGWGSFARFAAERYGVSVVGTTVSQEQAKLGEQRCHGFPVEIRLEDYRDTRGQFDRVVSIGMFEHVGKKNYHTFMKCVRRALKPDGLFLLHTIGGNKSTQMVSPWIQKYIFPDSLIPSLTQIVPAIQRHFVMEDWHNFGADYDRTLMAWWRNFEANWHRLRNRYDGRFYRMWRFYLLTCAGAFRARRLNLWQIVLSPAGVPGGYRRPR